MNIKDEVLKSEQQVITYCFTPVNDILTEKHGKAWHEYRAEWNESKRGKELSDRPLYILLELNSFCNLSCRMCKHASDENNRERISMDLKIFHKIVEECRQLKIPSFNIGSGTECTLHPQFKEIALNSKNTGAIDKFFLTNGTTLTDEMISNIFEGEFERVEISIDAATEDTYTKIRRRGNYSKLEKQINDLLSEKARRDVKLPIIRLSFCVQEGNIDEIDLFYEKWKDKVDIIDFQKVSVVPSDAYKSPSVKFCTQPFNRLTIDYNGDIFACCSILYQEKYCLGNIDNITLYEAWHGEKMTKIRNRFLEENPLPHCRECLLSIYG